MKKSIFLIGLMAMALSSCYQSVLDPLSGIFPSPTVVNDYASAAATSVKGEQGRLIDLDLTGSTTVHIAFVGNKYYLTENTYTEAQAMAAKNGNFIIGQTKVNGVSVKSGRVEVERAAVDTEKKDYSLDDVYTIKYVLFCEDGTPYKGTWSGKLAFHPDPVLGDIIVDNQMSDAVSATDAGMKKHLISLVDDSGNPSGTFEIFVEPTATSIAGTYVCKEYAELQGEAGLIANGYSIEWEGVVYAGGSYYMKDGNRVNIDAGQTVVIAPLSDKSYVFNVDGTEFVVAGTEIGEGIIFENAGVDSDSLTEAGKEKHMIYALLDDDIVAGFELFVEPDADITGTYLCKEYAELQGEAGLIANGYYIEWEGVVYSGGSFYMKDGTRVNINAGDVVTVAKAGDKLYSFCGDGFTVLVKF